jgi:hypothetical protein
MNKKIVEQLTTAAMQRSALIRFVIGLIIILRLERIPLEKRTYHAPIMRLLFAYVFWSTLHGSFQTMP